MRGTEERSGKEGSRERSEVQVFPRRGQQASLEGVLRLSQTEPARKGVRDAEQGDGGSARRWRACIAGQSLCPREPVMGALGAGKDRRRRVWDGLAG